MNALNMHRCGNYMCISVNISCAQNVLSPIPVIVTKNTHFTHFARLFKLAEKGICDNFESEM